MIFTVGYSKKDLTGFISQLEEHSIDILVDVREYPLSRKKGFSKTSLSESLKNSDIEYRHFKELGSPKDLRHKYIEDGDFEYFKSNFKKSYIGRKDTLRLLTDLASNKTLCLMCCEADWSGCHRSILAEELVDLHNGEIVVRHL